MAATHYTLIRHAGRPQFIVTKSHTRYAIAIVLLIGRLTRALLLRYAKAALDIICALVAILRVIKRYADTLISYRRRRCAVDIER